MKILIAGSRTFQNYQMMKTDFLSETFDNPEIISGCARGADLLAMQLAKELSLVVHKFPANWEKYGKKAGFIRNVVMVELCDFALIYWDGKSNGTNHTINLLKTHKKSYIIKTQKG